jgi:hypothetical protein
MDKIKKNINLSSHSFLRTALVILDWHGALTTSSEAGTEVALIL